MLLFSTNIEIFLKLPKSIFRKHPKSRIIPQKHAAKTTSSFALNLLTGTNRYYDEEWLGKVDLIPDSSINRRAFYVRYHQNKTLWDKAFDFLANDDLTSLTEGTHELIGKDLFVMVSEYGTKDSKEVYYESHENYTDIHYVVSGEEYISVRDRSGLSVKTPYNTDRDITFYNEQDEHNRLANSEVFFIFFPSDVHRPGIKVNESQVVKKIVVKVKTD